MRQTSLLSYQQTTLLRSDKRTAVYNCILAATKKYGDITDVEIMKSTGFTINCVTGRRNELLKSGMIQESNARLSRQWHTNHIHMAWKVTL
jgi:hypothetical protein